MILTVFVFGGCCCSSNVTLRTESPESGPPVVDSDPPADPDSPAEPGKKSKPKKDTPAKFHLPPGHLPSADECRIWIPGVPPGQQSPPGDCHELASEIPPGAWLIRGVDKKAKEFEVVVYHEVRPRVIVEIRIYSKKDGSFLGLR
jgi:hypothetical protein